MNAEDYRSLDRFLPAQDRDWPAITSELRAGHKTSHWMWYVFPQLRGLGTSYEANFWGIEDLVEAKAYLAHPVLGPRLQEVSTLVLSHPDAAPQTILGPIDAHKLRSCATLFQAAGPEEQVFTSLLDTFYEGAPCPATLDLLKA